MGQPINIAGTTVDGAIVLFHTDRSITGQDGVAFDSVEVAVAGGLPGELAAQLFASDDAIDHVFVASNQVVARREGDWTGAALTAAADVVSGFFVYYAGE